MWLIIDVEKIAVVPSFEGVQEMCKLAERTHNYIRCTILDRVVIAMPGDDPYFLYEGFSFVEEGGTIDRSEVLKHQTRFSDDELVEMGIIQPKNTAR